MMLGKLILKQTIKSAEADSISIDYGRCINNTGYEKTCRVCEDVCPEKAITKNGFLDPGICIACNSCSTVCPVQAIYPARSLIDTLDGSMQSDSENVVISCSRCGSNCGYYKVDCIGSVAWELYAALSLSKNIIMQTGVCDTCEKAAVKNLLTDKLRTFGGDDFWKNKISVVSSSCKGRDRYTRREIFEFAARKSGRKIKNISIMDYKKYSGMPFYRGYLIGKIRKAGEPAHEFNWWIPVFSDKCWGCGLCADICPNEAMIKVNEEMYIVPWLCTQCGICENYCPDGAISGYEKCDFDPLSQKYIKLNINKVMCSECGHAMRKRKGRYRCLYCGGK